MIKKLKMKFVAVAMLSITALLVVILGAINVVNFSLVTSDADKMLDMIVERNGQISAMQQTGEQPFARESEQFRPDGAIGGRGPMGPDSPDTQQSTRFFTIAFDAEGQARAVNYNLSAVSLDDAISWAAILSKKRSGWTNTTYRFRTYQVNGETFVTVIDQARELLPSYRVLWASLIGSAIGLAISLITLIFLAKKFVHPIVKSDLKQKTFIAEASREIKMPLTIVAIDKEAIKEQFGENDETKSIDRQVDKMFALSSRLDELVIFDEASPDKKSVDFSRLVERATGTFAEAFEKRNISVNKSIKPDIAYLCDEQIFEKMLYETFENAAAFAKTFVSVNLDEAGGRITLTVANDADGLKEGDCDTVFERFYKTEKSVGQGLGLSIVKSIVIAHGGRVRAFVKNGVFTVKFEF